MSKSGAGFAWVLVVGGVSPLPSRPGVSPHIRKGRGIFKAFHPSLPNSISAAG
jgi:hypothetical protein